MSNCTFCALSAFTRKVALRSLWRLGNFAPGTVVGAGRALSAWPQHDVQMSMITSPCSILTFTTSLCLRPVFRNTPDVRNDHLFVADAALKAEMSLASAMALYPTAFG